MQYFGIRSLKTGDYVVCSQTGEAIGWTNEPETTNGWKTSAFTSRAVAEHMCTWLSNDFSPNNVAAGHPLTVTAFVGA